MAASQTSASVWPPTHCLLGTGNPHKIAEFKFLADNSPCRLVSAEELGLTLPSVAETGPTAASNAALKATAFALATGHWVLADDTELRVAALGGKPGVHSARYAGQHATMTQNRHRLLADMEGLSDSQRGAEFVCHLCIAAPDGSIHWTARGACQGRILETPVGNGGFGYDALFWASEAGKTMAAFSQTELLRFGHRAIAWHSLLEQLPELANGSAPARLTERNSRP